MATGAVCTFSGINVVLNRAFKATPDNTAFIRGSIGTGTNTPAQGDTGLQTVLSGWNGGSDYKNYDSGFPSFDPANRRVSVQTFVASTSANGNTVTEYVDANSDATVSILGRFVFTGIVKTSSVEIYFKPIYRVL